MILVDANLLLYAYSTRSPDHGAARAWLETTLSDPAPVGLPWLSILAFLRISTNPRLRGDVLSMAEAIAIVGTWLERVNVTIVEPTERHWDVLCSLLIDGQAKGPLVSDAHLAALAVEHGATLFSADRGLRRFAGLTVVNPLASASG